MSVLHDLLHINGELAHWLFEAEGLLIGVAWHWFWQRRHDRRHHQDVGVEAAKDLAHKHELGQCRSNVCVWPKPHPEHVSIDELR